MDQLSNSTYNMIIAQNHWNSVESLSLFFFTHCISLIFLLCIFFVCCSYEDFWKYLEARREAPKSTNSDAYNLTALNRKNATGKEVR
jgi:hypothetical protein